MSTLLLLTAFENFGKINVQLETLCTHTKLTFTNNLHFLYCDKVVCR